jgi:hypothetical protein
MTAWTSDQQAAEFDDSLRHSDDIRAVLILNGLDAGLTMKQISAEYGCDISGHMTDIRNALAGIVPTAPSVVLGTARVVRYVRDMAVSESLRDAIDAYLRRLHEINPAVPLDLTVQPRAPHRRLSR